MADVDDATSKILRLRYEAADQGHVFQYWDELTSTERQELIQQLSGIAVEQLSSLLQHALAEQQAATNLSSSTGSSAASDESSMIRPFSKPVGQAAVTYENDIQSLQQQEQQQQVQTWNAMGLDAIRQGHVVALVLAGGQGTRLGFDGPKGMYDIGLPSHKSLFQLVAERIRKLCQLAAATTTTNNNNDNDFIPFYLMTSPLNHQETIDFFQSHSYFGLNPSSVHFFPQGMLPCLDNQGKMILETRSRVAMAPDGNGGIYPSLQASGALKQMIEQYGAKYLHVFSIDNVLVKPADPVFMGYCISQQADCGNKVVWRCDAQEKVGVMAERGSTGDGRRGGGGGGCMVVEYSDMSTEMAERVDPTTGRLVFGAANICNHFYTLDFLQNVVLQHMNHMYHVARKKIPYYDPTTRQTMTPQKTAENTNGMKLETFIFDVFPLANNMAVLEVNRWEEFAPVKNAPDANNVDSPTTARRAMSNRCHKWVVQAGATTVAPATKKDEEDSSLTNEISPLTSYAGEGLEELVQGKEIMIPFVL